MICVTNIEYFKVEGDFIKFTHAYNTDRPVAFTNMDEPVDIKMAEEYVYGKRFHSVLGEEVCLGINKDANKILGFPFEVIDNQSKIIHEQSKELGNLRTELLSIKTMGLWDRIKRVFKK